MIIIMGAAGFSGSNIVADFYARGLPDLLLADDLGTRFNWKNIAKRRFLELVNYCNLDLLPSRLPDKTDTVFQLCTGSSTTSIDGDENLRVNPISFMFWWKWCARTEMPLIYASSVATYRDMRRGINHAQNLPCVGNCHFQPLWLVKT